MGWLNINGNWIGRHSGQKSWSSYWNTLNRNRNTDTIEVACYDAVDNVGTDVSFPTTGRWYLNKNNKSKVRQTGVITAFKIGVSNTNDLHYFQVWRKNGANYDLIGEEEVTSKLVGPSAPIFTVTLTTPISVIEGDLIGFGAIGGVLGGCNVKATTAVVSLKYSNGEKPATTNYNFDGALSLQYNFPIKGYMQAPLIVGIGDSIMAGHPGHYSYIEDSLTDSKANQILYQLKVLYPNLTYQNMGIGSQTTTNIKNRFAADVVALKPKAVLINGGVNDIALGGANTKTAFLANYTTMLNACVAASIVPIVCKILPWTGGSNAQMQTRDDWNSALETLVASYSGAVCLDFDSAIGKFRAGGDANNLWDLKTEYDSGDNVHPNLACYTKMAEVIYRRGR